MQRTQRILVGAITVTALLAAARPGAELVRSMPDVDLLAVPQNASVVEAVDRSQQTSRSDSRREAIQAQEFQAQELAATAQDRSEVLSEQVSSIEQQNKVLKKKAAKAAAVKKAAAKKKAAKERAAAAKARKATEVREAAAAKRAKEAESKSSARSSSGSSSRSKSSGGSGSAPSGSPKAIARSMMSSGYGWGDSQYSCYNKIITQESGWNYKAKNPSSGAYGIPQALPGSKMASAGSDWQTNPATQIKWSLGYIKDRYGSPCKAWSFKQGTGWY